MKATAVGKAKGACFYIYSLTRDWQFRRMFTTVGAKALPALRAVMVVANFERGITFP